MSTLPKPLPKQAFWEQWENKIQEGQVMTTQDKSLITDMKDNSSDLEVANCDLQSNNHIEHAIYTIRGIQVMADRDLATLYGVETKRLNEMVKRNLVRFPERFMFQLTTEEFEDWKSQIATSDFYSNAEKEAIRRGLRRPPYVFSEQGISQLSAVLRSATAIEMSIRIIDAFVAMRRFLSTNAEVYRRLTSLEHHQLEAEVKIETILNKMEENNKEIDSEQIFATGCVWDAWNYVSQLIRNASLRIILIDNYVDERVLYLLSKRKDGVPATIHSRYSQQFMIDLAKYNEQYPAIEFIQLSQKAHDRFLILDDKVFLLGASVKDMGKSLCAITLMEITPEKVLELI